MEEKNNLNVKIVHKNIQEELKGGRNTKNGMDIAVAYRLCNIK